MTMQRISFTQSKPRKPLAACAGVRARGVAMALRGLYFGPVSVGRNHNSGMRSAFIGGGNAANDSEILKGSA